MSVEIAPGDQPLEIDDYVVIEEIGRGAMKIVFRATNRHTGKDVALAVLKFRYPDTELKTRFKRESEVMERLKHPNIVAIEKSGESEGQPFIAMENVGGGTIADQLLFGPAGIDQITTWLPQICDAVQFAHDAGLIHRDLKPENILLTDEGVPKIADFGLVKAASQDQPLTRVGQSLGTLHYVSPEQLCGDQVTKSSDIYSLGVTLFEMLVGRKQFLQITKSSQVGGLPAEIEKRMSESTSAMEQSLFGACMTCTLTDPAERFLSARMLSDAIQSAVNAFNSTPIEVLDLEPYDSRVLKRGYVVGNTYTLEIPLDQGAMGEVWRASAADHAHKVVVKFVSLVHRHNQAELDRFRDSFRIVGAIHHENICPLYAMGTDPKAGIYIVMKFHEGITLAQYCQRKRSNGRFFTIHEVCKILYPIARAIDHSHKHNVLHRDVKPANIIVSEINEEIVPVLIDFGLAEIIQSTRIGEPNRQPPSGTYRYIAPEVWAGQALQSPSDQYALGIVAYEMLSGAPPFSSVPDDHLPHCAQHNPIPLLQGISDKANEVLGKVLNKQPKMRFGSCCDFIIALEKALSTPVPFTEQGSILKASASRVATPRNFKTQQRASETSYSKSRRSAVLASIVIVALVVVLAFSLPWRITYQHDGPVLYWDEEPALAWNNGQVEVWPLRGWSEPIVCYEDDDGMPFIPHINNVDIILKRGFEFLESGQYSSAKQAAETVIALNDSKDSAYVLRGAAFLNEGRFDDALTDFEKALSINPRNALAYAYCGRLHFFKKEHELAVIDCSKSMSLDATIEQAPYIKGFAEVELNRLDDAVNSFTATIQINGENADAYAERGYVLMRQRKYDDSLDDLNRALELKPKSVRAMVYRGSVFHEQKKYEIAISEFEKSIQFEPSNELAFHGKALSEFELGRISKAVESASAAIDLRKSGSKLFIAGPNDVTHVLRGKAFAKLGQPENALQDFSRAVTLNAKNSEAHLYLANLLQQQEKYGDAIAEYNATLAIDPRSEPAFYGRGVAELRLGLSGDAIESLTSAIGISPERPDAFFKRGTIYQERELYQKAIDDFQAVKGLDKDYGGIDALIEMCEAMQLTQDANK